MSAAGAALQDHVEVRLHALATRASRRRRSGRRRGAGRGSRAERALRGDLHRRALAGRSSRRAEPRHLRSAGRTSRFHDACACAAVLKTRRGRTRSTRRPPLAKPGRRAPTVVRSDWFGSKLLQVTTAPLPSRAPTSSPPAGRASFGRPLRRAFPAAVYWRFGGEALAATTSTAAASTRDGDERGRRAPRARAPSVAAGDRELVLGVADALLDLPAVGGRLARARSPRARPARPRAARAPARRRSRSRSTAASTRAIARSWITWKKPGPVANWSTSARRRVDARRARLQRRDERSVPREHADLADLRRGRSIISASPSNAAPSGVTSETLERLAGARHPPPTPPRAACRARRASRSRRPCRRPARAARRACPR